MRGDLGGRCWFGRTLWLSAIRTVKLLVVDRRFCRAKPSNEESRAFSGIVVHPMQGSQHWVFSEQKCCAVSQFATPTVLQHGAKSCAAFLQMTDGCVANGCHDPSREVFAGSPWQELQEMFCFSWGTRACKHFSTWIMTPFATQPSEKCCATFRSMLQNSGGGKLGNSTSAWKQSLVSGYMSRRLL